MKYRRLILGLTSGWILVLGISQAVSAQARLTVVEPDFDFGTVVKNSVIVHTFDFAATGVDTLLVTEIKTGCGCIAVVPEQLSLAPGDTVPVTFFWDTRNSEDEVTKRAYVFTSASRDPSGITLKADCRENVATDGRPLAVNSAKLVFSSIGRLSQRLTFSNLTAEGYQIRVADVSMVGVLASVVSVIAPEEIAPSGIDSVSVSMNQADWTTDFFGSITFEFDAEAEAGYRVTIPVAGPTATGKQMQTRK